MARVHSSISFERLRVCYCTFIHLASTSSSQFAFFEPRFLFGSVKRKKRVTWQITHVKMERPGHDFVCSSYTRNNVAYKICVYMLPRTRRPWFTSKELFHGSPTLSLEIIYKKTITITSILLTSTLFWFNFGTSDPDTILNSMHQPIQCKSLTWWKEVANLLQH